MHQKVKIKLRHPRFPDNYDCEKTMLVYNIVETGKRRETEKDKEQGYPL